MRVVMEAITIHKHLIPPLCFVFCPTMAHSRHSVVMGSLLNLLTQTTNMHICVLGEYAIGMRRKMLSKQGAGCLTAQHIVPENGGNWEMCIRKDRQVLDAAPITLTLVVHTRG